MTSPSYSTVSGLSALVVDDEPNIRRTLQCCLESRGYRVTAVSNAQDAQAQADMRVFDLAFIDVRLGADNGLDLIPVLLRTCPWLKIIVITAYASIESAVEALHRGAADYIPKPFTPQQVGLVAERVAAVRSLERRITDMKENLDRLHPEVSFSSRYPSMQRALELARQVATSDAAVLLLGPSGSGKTVLARAIHGWSRRSEFPMGIVSCPSLSAELMESELFGHALGAFTGAVRDSAGRVAACEGGTIFLDEIGDLPQPIQPKLLRFIQDHEYERVGDSRTRAADVRIIAATNTKLEQAVKEGRFREDLYYRLNVIQIDLPPLADRPDDVERMANEMLSFFGAQNHKALSGFTGEAIGLLRAYAWPGNIRELRNVVERAAILCATDRVGVEHFPASLAPRSPLVQLGDAVPLDVIEENHIRRVVAASRSLQEAADILGVDQATLWRKRKEYGI